MRILDKYIMKKFLLALMGTILGWLVLFIIIDMVEHLDDFLSNNATLWQITRYYIMYIPFSMILTMPVSVLISVLFSMGMMALRSRSCWDPMILLEIFFIICRANSF